jgi:hypothetical protein
MFSSMTDLVARVVNRSFVGPDLCRRPDYIRTVVRYAQTFMFYGMALKLLPESLKSYVACLSAELRFFLRLPDRFGYALMAAAFGGKREPLKYLRPHIRDYIMQREGGRQQVRNTLKFCAALTLL